MEPRIQYAKTQDGVNIAYSTMGEGAPLVSVPNMPYGHLTFEWGISEIRRWYERLATQRMVVRFDCRGSGLSQRDIANYSLEAYLLDLEAVVKDLGLKRFDLFGFFNSGPVAIAYTERHPERVSHLVLWCTWARRSESPQFRALPGLLDTDWELYTETLAHLALGWPEGKEARRAAAWLRESTTQEAARAAHSAIREFDVTALLPQMRPPALVLHRHQVVWPEVDLSRDLAAQVPNGQLVVLEGASAAPWMSDMEAGASAIDEFLSEGEEEEPPTPAPGGFATILFTDMASSTALTQQIGDAGAQEVRHAHDEIVRAALTANGGNEIKHTGDGIMASFATASSALECAIAIQRGVAAHKDAHPDSPLAVYVGLNAGEPIAEEQDLFGTSVDLAARLVDHAQPGQIIASDVVRQLSAGKDFLFSDLGETELRGFEDPVKLWELRWEA